jgi:hypothetical protein
MPVRWLPNSARVEKLPEAGRLVAALRTACIARTWGVPPEHFHRTGRFRTDLQRVLSEELEARLDEVDAVVRAVARSVFSAGTELAVQKQPYVRVVPPETPEAVKDFHWDAYIGHPHRQWGLWIPLTDIEGPEGMWLVDDEVVAPWLAHGELTPEAGEAMRRAARPVPMQAGEVLVMHSMTGHGGIPHVLDRTRVSFDVRFALADDAPSRAPGWRGRRITL